MHLGLKDNRVKKTNERRADYAANASFPRLFRAKHRKRLVFSKQSPGAVRASVRAPRTNKNKPNQIHAACHLPDAVNAAKQKRYVKKTEKTAGNMLNRIARIPKHVARHQNKQKTGKQSRDVSVKLLPQKKEINARQKIPDKSGNRFLYVQYAIKFKYANQRGKKQKPKQNVAAKENSAKHDEQQGNSTE